MFISYGDENLVVAAGGRRGAYTRLDTTPYHHYRTYRHRAEDTVEIYKVNQDLWETGNHLPISKVAIQKSH